MNEFICGVLLGICITILALLLYALRSIRKQADEQYKTVMSIRDTELNHRDFVVRATERIDDGTGFERKLE